jgi:hypothetical protein
MINTVRPELVEGSLSKGRPFGRLSPNGLVWQAAHDTENERPQRDDNGRLATQGHSLEREVL